MEKWENIDQMKWDEREIKKMIQFTIAYKDVMGFLGSASGK